MSDVIKLIVAEDYPLLRQGFCLALNQFERFDVVGDAGNGAALVELLEQTAADVVITDIMMPEMDGIEATKIIRQRFPAIKIIALTSFGDDRYIADMMDAGCNGYVLKNTDVSILAEVIELIDRGGSYFCQSSSMNLLQLVAKSKALDKARNNIAFSEKEQEIIQLMCREYASKQIADATQLSLRTVEKYRSRIMEKIGTGNMVGVVVYAIRNGMFTI